MKMRNWMIGTVIAGTLGIGALGAMAYNYTTKLNHELDTYVLPHTTFEGVSLDGKTKDEVQKTIQQKVEEWNNKSITYSLQGKDSTYSWKELGVSYKGLDIADTIFKEQKGSLQERYQLRKKANQNGLNRSYKLEPYLDTAKYDATMKDRYNELLTKPSNASISIAGTAVAITPGTDGQKVNKDKLRELSIQAIKDTAAKVEVPLTAVKPERTAEDIESMGIKEVIAEYRTSVSGRNSSQVFNVARAANTLSGVFIAPDETFSFNSRVGITDAANGYKTAAVYVNGKVEQSAGGGVCQMSSTLYGAILQADLSIVERSNHSMPVHYVPLGQDATVADYGPDLKFKNNTGHHIYIQSFVEGGSTVVRIFGTKTGKEVFVSSQVVGENDKSITVVTYKTVKQNGQVIQSGMLNRSVYKKSAA
ncbi:VanW family protein [Ectobacillus ponti]|uniref:VanW family protein n=1 Tax=Ectobacillus ponti TaxID=2961894 RepID=A0AA41X6A3_9BACI|nr:VanW family protein [Ectobacillus ponti]MCP8969487.1 VanW family protein [Ectobacillus ponti]